MNESKRMPLISILKVYLGIIGILIVGQAYSQTTDIASTHPESKDVSVMINQVGYDINGEKTLLVQVRDTLGKQAGQDYQLIDKTGKIAFSGKLVNNGRMNKDTPGDWGAQYWSGNFSQFKTKGEYQARIKVGNKEYSSFPFRIEPDILYKETMQPAEHFFIFQRCGDAVPGMHPACHLDDTRIPVTLGSGRKNAVGGWHDAGDLNKYATIACRSVYALLIAARSDSKPELQEKSTKELLDEGLWGAEWLFKMWQPGKGIIYQEVWDGYDYFGTPDKQTNNVPETADDRPFRGEGPSAMTAAALAAAARATGRKDYREAAEDLWLGAVKCASSYPEDIWAVTSGSFVDRGELVSGRFIRRTADLLLADLELEALTGDQRYIKNAQSCIETLAHEQKPDGLWPTDVYSRTALQGFPPAALALYVRAHPGTHSSEIAIKALRLWMDRIILLTNNPFSIIPWAEGVFFNPDLEPFYYVGQNSQYMTNAWALYLTTSILREPRAAQLANRQLDWILGMNPYNMSMVEGSGSFNSPRYLHWTPLNDRGAIPGAIPNGFCRQNAKQDIPFFDLYNVRGSYNTAEPWEPHNAFYILAVSARAHVAGKKTMRKK